MGFWAKHRAELLFAAVALFIGAIGGAVTQMGMEAFDAAAKPWFTPPKWVFPVVWTVLYVLMGWAMGRVWNAREGNLQRCLLLFGLQLVVNFFWTLWFFLLQWYALAFAWLILLIGLVIAMGFCFYEADHKAGYLQVPYVVWLLLAAAMNYGVWLMN